MYNLVQNLHQIARHKIYAKQCGAYDLLEFREAGDGS